MKRFKYLLGVLCCCILCVGGSITAYASEETVIEESAVSERPETSEKPSSEESRVEESASEEKFPVEESSAEEAATEEAAREETVTEEAATKETVTEETAVAEESVVAEAPETSVKESSTEEETAWLVSVDFDGIDPSNMGTETMYADVAYIREMLKVVCILIFAAGVILSLLLGVEVFHSVSIFRR